MTPRSFAGPRIWGVFLLVVGVVVLVATTQVRSPEGYAATGPRFAPLVVGVAIVLLSLVFLARTVVRPDVDLGQRAARERAATHWPTPLLVLGALVAYLLLLEPLGYVVATTLFVPVGARVLGSRRPVRDVVVGLAIGLGVFVAFTEFLGVPLPGGLTPIT